MYLGLSRFPVSPGWRASRNDPRGPRFFFSSRDPSEIKTINPRRENLPTRVSRCCRQFFHLSTLSRRACNDRRVNLEGRVNFSLQIGKSLMFQTHIFSLQTRIIRNFEFFLFEKDVFTSYSKDTLENLNAFS